MWQPKESTLSEWFVRFGPTDADSITRTCRNGHTVRLSAMQGSKGHLECPICRRLRKNRHALGTHKEETRLKFRDIEKRNRLEAIEIYGGKCSWPGCNINDPDMLVFDHVNDDGAKHRKTTPAGPSFVRWLKKEGWPDSIQLLCSNHNMKKDRARMGLCEF